MDHNTLKQFCKEQLDDFLRERIYILILDTAPFVEGLFSMLERRQRPKTPPVEMMEHEERSYKRKYREPQRTRTDTRSRNRRRPYGPGLAERALVVENIPQEQCRERYLEDFYRRFGRIENIEVNQSDRKAIVHFSSENEARDALESLEPVLGNRFISVFLESDYYYPRKNNEIKQLRNSIQRIRNKISPDLDPIVQQQYLDVIQDLEQKISNLSDTSRRNASQIKKDFLDRELDMIQTQISAAANGDCNNETIKIEQVEVPNRYSIDLRPKTVSVVGFQPEFIDNLKQLLFECGPVDSCNMEENVLMIKYKHRYSAEKACLLQKSNLGIFSII